MHIARGLLGLVVLLLLAFLLSNNKKRIDWKLVATGVGLQVFFAVLILKGADIWWPLGYVEKGFKWVAEVFVGMLNYSSSGAEFLFGNLMDVNSYGFIFAFQVLPTIVFFSAFTSLLYYLGILQGIVYVFAWVMSKTMRLSGAESLAAAGNIFLGQTESPLLIRPYLEKMTPSEIMCLMTGGMATIAGGVFVAYIGFLGGTDPAMKTLFAKHLLSASIMSAPAAIVAAKMLFPENEPEKINRQLKIPKEKVGGNALEALSIGTTDGLKLAVNVGAILLVFTALIALLNGALLWFGGIVGVNDHIASMTHGQFEGLTMQYLLGMVFSPLAWLLGVKSGDMLIVGQLLGEKTILNEFYAYASMSKLKDTGVLINERSIIIATYALCGFANFASIGIQIGGISVLAPNQRGTLAKLGVKALIGGTIACFMTAAIAGMLV